MTTITQQVVEAARKRGLTVLTHEEWGSKLRPLYADRRRKTKNGYWGRFRQQADTVVSHITVTFDDGKLVGDFKRDMLEVERIGYERFGSGVSYNFCVDMATGMVGVGQPLDSKGTHTVNDKGVPGFSKDQNLVARAVAGLGMPGDKFSKDAERAYVKLLKAMRECGAITPGFDLVPHSLFAFKDCPTDAIRDRLPDIRERVTKRPVDRPARALQEY